MLGGVHHWDENGLRKAKRNPGKFGKFIVRWLSLSKLGWRTRKTPLMR
jgi:hypothetical protein